MQLLEELDAIHRIVESSPKDPDEQTRRRFWRIVGKIKRMPTPDDPLIAKAAEIRDLLYEARLGTPKTLKLLVVFLLLGALSTYGYIWAITLGPQYTGFLLNDIVFVIGLRALMVFGAVAFLYPFGRLLGGKAFGIRLDGISRDPYYEPTLKVNYVSYLKASPPRRQWFFFVAGIWTVITAGWVGLLGYILGDIIGLVIMLLLLIFEMLAILSGSRKAGEMGHFNRERRIVRDWKRAIAETSTST
jgi:hypothetical protein